MKVITNSITNVALYAFDDSQVVLPESDRIVIGEPPVLIIGDYSSDTATADTATVYENVTVPEDWRASKFLYDGSWSDNPDWVEPVELQLDENGNQIVPELDENGEPIQGEPNA
jgi:hypothetical protein